MYQLTKIFLIFALQIFSLQSAEAQIRGKYAIGGFGNTGSLVSSYSGPVYIKGHECLVIANGIKTLSKAGQGIFTMACKEIQKDLMQITAYPNPVTSVLTVRTLAKLPVTNNNQYVLRLVDMSGRIVKVVKADLTALDNGLKIPVEELSKGYYALSLFSATEILETVKIVKN